MIKRWIPPVFAAAFAVGAAVSAAGEDYAQFEKYRFADDRQGIMQNEDCTQFFCTFRYPATEEGLKRYIDEGYLVPGHQIREFLLNPQSQTFCYPSRVGTYIVDNVTFSPDGAKAFYKGKELPPGTAKMLARYKAFSDAGINPWAVWTKHLRERGVSPWITLRMNDVHGGGNWDIYSRGEFYKSNLDKRIAAYREGWSSFAHELDYAAPEVRQHMLDTVQEVLDLFDPDGIDLDFMRWGAAFRYGHEQRGREIMNQFIRDVRAKIDAAAQKNGHPVKLCVRVHAMPADAWGSGFDVETWAREGLIDVIAPATFFDSSFHEIPIRDWRRIVGDKVRIAPSLDANAQPYERAERLWDSWLLRALTTQYLAQGADRIYLFNHFGSWRKEFGAAGALETASVSPRRHAVLFNDYPAMGRRGDCYLPVIKRGWSAFRLSVGAGPDAGRPCRLVVGSRSAGVPELVARFNGEVLKKSADLPAAGFDSKLNTILSWEIPVSLIQSEDNVIEFMTANGYPEYRIDWVEIFIASSAKDFKPTGSTAKAKKLAPTAEELVANKATVCKKLYGQDASADTGVLKLKQLDKYITVTDPDFLNPGSHKLEIRGEMRLGAPVKAEDTSFLIGFVLPDGKTGFWRTVIRFAPGRIAQDDGKKGTFPAQGWVPFTLRFDPETGVTTVTADGKTQEFPAKRNAGFAKPSLSFGDSSGGVSGTAELKDLVFELL